MGRRPAVVWQSVRWTKGVSNIEALTALGISSALAAISLPSFLELVEARRLRGAAEALAMELRFAVSESNKTSDAHKVRMRATALGDVWCFAPRAVMNDTADEGCICDIPTSCAPSAAAAIVRSEDFRHVRMTSNVPYATFATQPKRNTLTAGNVEFTTSSGRQLRVVVNGYGRIRVCVPVGAPTVSGYSVC